MSTAGHPGITPAGATAGLGQTQRCLRLMAPRTTGCRRQPSCVNRAAVRLDPVIHDLFPRRGIDNIGIIWYVAQTF